jgi:AAA domain
MNMTEQSQHIIRISAENVKNVKVIDFAPNRYVTKVSGANGAGKTSALDAVFYALAGRKTLPPSLIRQGQKRGHIRIETNSHIITRRLDEKGGSLQIEAKDTNTLVKAPDDWLEAIAGDLGFDPLKFMRLKPEEQFAVLKSLVPMDEDVDQLESQNADDAETITKRKAEMKRLEATREHIAVDSTLPEEPIDIDALLSEARALSAHNREIEQQQRERDALTREFEREYQRVSDIQDEIEKLTKELKAKLPVVEDMEATIQEWQPLPEPKDRRALDDQISEASSTNARISTNNTNRTQRAKFEEEIDGIKDELEKLSETIRERKLTISRTLEKAKFPIPGLSFETQEEGSGGRERKNPKKVVTYHGLPLSDASSGEQIRVSTAIGMAGKPELRFLLIREGSLLDENGMAILEQMAHENDWQILIEQVDTSGKVGVYMEDGEVKAVNQEPEEKPNLNRRLSPRDVGLTPQGAPKKTTRKNSKQGELLK